ncbi:MAG: tetratricopeptide repeat protein [Candidatus Omnitrophota bacterium]|nr:tetratricopeptide repeat protein [Candidatus Omnitrophota bacterium]
MNKLRLVKFFAGGLLCLVVVFSLGSSFAQETGTAEGNRLFYQGNVDYKEAKFQAAIDNYLKVLNLGLESGNLYYNLGNSYFKKGELGRAMLNYERALMFIPNDSDLKSNHEYVLSLLNLGQQSFENWLGKIANKLFAGVSVNFLTVLLSFIYILALLVLTSSLIFAQAQRSIKFLFFILPAVFIITAISLNSKIVYLNKGAVVVSKEALVKFEPREGATTYFKLSEGSKVLVLDKTQNWYKIKRPDGKIGWLDKDKLGLILDLTE